MRHTTFTHEFVDSFPPEVQEGVLYVSVRYATAAHNCACGCGNKVVTPIKPAGWHLLFDGKTVSLTPSINNGQFPCRSHYWIEADQVRWARALSIEESATGRRRDERDYERYFAERLAAHDGGERTDTAVQTEGRSQKGILARVMRLFARR